MAMDTNQVVGNDNIAEQAASASRRWRTQVMGLKDRVGGQALAMRDTVREHPKTSVGLAAALVGVGAVLMARSAARARRRRNRIAGIVAAFGVWRMLSPLLRKARKAGPKLSREGARLSREGAARLSKEGARGLRKLNALLQR
jgi:hypothetical protein